MIDIPELLVKNRIQRITTTYKPWITKGGNVLDVGSGNGIVTEGLAKLLSLRTTGCDIEQYLLRDIPYIQMKSDDELPFPSSTFETVMFNDVLHHTSKKNQVILLKEAIRVARKNIVIFELLPTTLAYVFDYCVNKLYHASVPVPFTFRSIAEWQTVFRKLPVRVETKRIQRPFFSPFSHVAFNLTKVTLSS